MGKWKQLVPKILPGFCPSCKGQLELASGPRMGDSASFIRAPLVERMHRRWREIFSEVAEALGIGEPAGESLPQIGGNHWRSVLASFQESFPSPPEHGSVRNWNSVYGRRRHYHGVVRRHSDRRYVCSLMAQRDVQDETVRLPTSREERGDAKHLFLDWQGDLIDGQRIAFV